MRENTDQKTPNTATFYAVLSIIIMKYMTQVIVYIASTFVINTYAFIQLKMERLPYGSSKIVTSSFI